MAAGRFSRSDRSLAPVHLNAFADVGCTKPGYLDANASSLTQVVFRTPATFLYSDLSKDPYSRIVGGPTAPEHTFKGLDFHGLTTKERYPLPGQDQRLSEMEKSRQRQRQAQAKIVIEQGVLSAIVPGARSPFEWPPPLQPAEARGSLEQMKRLLGESPVIEEYSEPKRRVKQPYVDDRKAPQEYYDAERFHATWKECKARREMIQARNTQNAGKLW
jgi:hypothetical protein